MRDRYDFLVTERGPVTNVVQHALPLAVACASDTRRRGMAEEPLGDVVGQLVHVALDAPHQPVELDPRIEPRDGAAELDGIRE